MNRTYTNVPEPRFVELAKSLITKDNEIIAVDDIITQIAALLQRLEIVENQLTWKES